MNAMVADPAVRARRAHAMLVKAMHEPGKQAALAVQLGVSESTVSRFKSEQLEQLCNLIAHLGLKVVPAEHTCVSPETYQFLTSTHARVMQRAPELIWDTDL